MRKIIIILSGLAAAGWVLLMTARVLLLLAERVKKEEPVQIYTETEPIYNHFPGLPQTQEIQWCSRSSDGIGLTTTFLYFYAYYDHDISKELQEMEIENQSGDIELYFVPDSVKEDEKWRHVENAGSVFQAGIKDTQKMCATVSINEAGTILYVEAVGD